MKTMKTIMLGMMLILAAGAWAADKKVIREGSTVTVKGVYKLVNYGSATLHIVQGTGSTVRVVEKGVIQSEVYVEDGKLTIQPGGNLRYGDNELQTDVYVTLPSLREISNNCSLHIKGSALGTRGETLNITNGGLMDIAVDAFDCGSIELLNFGSMGLATTKLVASGRLKISNSGSMRLNVSDRVYGSPVFISNSGSLEMKTPVLKGDKVEFINFGSIAALQMAVECSSYKHSNSGSERNGNTVRVTAPTVYISNSGVLSDNFDVTAKNTDRMDVVNFGMMDSKVKFNGKSAKFSTNGTGTIAASVKCSDLTLSNTGTGTIKVDGSTGDLWMSGSNSNGIDVRKLTTSGKAKGTFFDAEGGNSNSNGNSNWQKKVNEGSVNQYNP